MRGRQNLLRALAAVGVAAACAALLDAAVVLASDSAPPATTQPAAPVPSTQPLLIGRVISNDYARPVAAVPHRPMLTPTANAGSGTSGPPATITLGAGVDAGDTRAAPPVANSGLSALPTSRPAAVPSR
jgi:hypothetical protein